MLVRAGPAARHLASIMSLPIQSFVGTGPKGTVTKWDVLNAKNGKTQAPLPVGGSPFPPQHVTLSLGPKLPVVNVPGTLGTWEDIPTSTMRRTVARRLTESKTTVPHAYLATEVRTTQLAALRKLIEAQRGTKVSLNDLIVKCIGHAVAKVPAANVHAIKGEVRQLKDVSVAVAVALEGGLITPVVTGVNDKDAVTVSTTIKELSKRAKEGKLLPHEYTGGSTSVSNLGMMGISGFTAVLNPPQVTIFSIGTTRTVPRPVNGALAFEDVMEVALSYDANVLSADEAAELLQAFKGIAEDPISAL